jgi:hypothetical protein
METAIKLYKKLRPDVTSGRFFCILELWRWPIKKKSIRRIIIAMIPTVAMAVSRKIITRNKSAKKNMPCIDTSKSNSFYKLL